MKNNWNEKTSEGVSRLEGAEWISDLEDSQAKRKKNLKNEEKLRELCLNIKSISIHILKIPKEEERKG